MNRPNFLYKRYGIEVIISTNDIKNEPDLIEVGFEVTGHSDHFMENDISRTVKFSRVMRITDRSTEKECLLIHDNFMEFQEFMLSCIPQFVSKNGRELRLWERRKIGDS